MAFKIFVDIGAYTGDTLDLALQYDYDVIHCLEPVQKHFEDLIHKVSKLIDGPMVLIHPYGLLDKNTFKRIHAAGSDGASIFPEKKQFNHQGKIEVCLFKDAERLFRELWDADTLDVKINCEGAELAIIERLIESDRIEQIDNLCIHYDVLKIPGMENKADHMEKMLNDYFDGRRLTVGRNKLVHSDYPEADLSQGKKWVANWLKHINS